MSVGLWKRLINLHGAEFSGDAGAYTLTVNVTDDEAALIAKCPETIQAQPVPEEK